MATPDAARLLLTTADGLAIDTFITAKLHSSFTNPLGRTVYFRLNYKFL